MTHWQSALRRTIGVTAALIAGFGAADVCPSATPGEKQLLWGDLHVHTSHSLDAWAFGAIATPQDAYAFARGQPLRLINGDTKTIDRPLDFAAVTDHAETWDQMYLCTDPIYADDAYCSNLRKLHDARESLTIFNDYLLPVVGGTPPASPSVCENDDFNCTAARMGEWRRAQFAANQANEPCEFTALIGYEWTGSPGGLHWHRNVIFKSADVPDQAFDFIRFPEVQMLWRELDANCREADGCEVLTIPHNLNWADGGPIFAVETESADERALRARFERLAEMFQEKGASECLPERRVDLDEDCSFNLVFENAARDRLSGPDESTPREAWARARSTYYRSLLGRGLATSGAGVNPLMLGAIGSTDTHFGTPGRVSESDYDRGISTLFATDETQLGRLDFNPGGLVAVWAEANTRGAVFDALYRREAYATSGPRIGLKFGVGEADFCEHPNASMTVTMGGTLPAATTPRFVIQASRDRARLEKVQIIKGEYLGGATHERVIDVATFPEGRDSVCLTWLDEAHDPAAPAYWYARVIEEPTPRWSKHLCERADLCDEFPDADTKERERAWSSPVWSLPL